MPGLRLEIFDTAAAPDGGLQPLVEVSALEEAKIASYEQAMLSALALPAFTPAQIAYRNSAIASARFSNSPP